MPHHIAKAYERKSCKKCGKGKRNGVRGDINTMYRFHFSATLGNNSTNNDDANNSGYCSYEK